MSNKSKEENKNTYWRDREEEHLRQNKLDEAEYDKRIRKIYGDMLQDVQKQINAFYGRYAAREGITLADAKKRISKADMKQLERKAQQYVEDKEFSQEANERMRLYNATMRINRLEMLKAELGMALIDGHQELDEYMEKLLQGRTEDELKRMAGILGTTIRNNSQTAQNIVNASFHNATFSNRIWMHQDLLKADVDKLLQQGLIQGKNPRVLAKELEKRFAVTSTNAERLMRTELARVQTDAQVQSFIKNGFDEYTFNALQNARAPACDLCQPLDGKHFKIADMVIGENAPPLHPNCRCSISAYMDDEAYEAWLDHMANGGEEVDWQTFRKKAKPVERKPVEKKPAEKAPDKPKPVANYSKSATITSEAQSAAKSAAPQEPKEPKIVLASGEERAMNTYASSGSYIINEKLRQQVDFSDDEKETVKQLDAALKKFPTYAGNLTRSLMFNSDEDAKEFVGKHEKGSKMTYNEYLSTTKGGIYNPDGQVQIIIRNSKNGRDISKLYPRENEVLYERGSTFKVIDIAEKDGKTFILLEESDE